MSDRPGIPHQIAEEWDNPQDAVYDAEDGKQGPPFRTSERGLYDFDVSDLPPVDSPEEAKKKLGALKEENEKLRDALKWTQHNFHLAVQNKPVRDMAENLAFNEAVLGEPR